MSANSLSRRRALATLFATLLACGALTGCPSGPKPKVDCTENPGAPECQGQTQKEQKPDWQAHSVILRVQGNYTVFNKDWSFASSGTGVLVDPTHVVTNAHVIMRAESIEARDDKGNTLVVDKVAALDIANDLAVLELAEPVDIPELPLVQRTNSIRKDLLGRNVVAIGNTGTGEAKSISDMKLFMYKGSVTNLMEVQNQERVFHNADIAPGSSGGPLFDAETFELIGVNNAINYKFKHSFAIPAWDARTMLTRAKANEGVKVAEAFAQNDDLDIKSGKSGRVCFKPGQSVTRPFKAAKNIDIGFKIEPEDPSRPVAIAGYLYLGKKGTKLLGYNTAISKPSVEVMSIPVDGTYFVKIGNASKSGPPACAQISIGPIDWEAGIK